MAGSSINGSKRSRSVEEEIIVVDATKSVTEATEAEDSDDDFGPQPITEAESSATANKKRRVLPHEKLYLNHLPSADRYFKSFMHRDLVTQIEITSTNFVITASVDGHLKFWKKQELGIEFVKHYRTHLSPILSLSTSTDGKSLAALAFDSIGSLTLPSGETVPVQGSAKIFDVENFDMINILKLNFRPRICCWVHGKGVARTVLAISDLDSSKIRLYDGRGDGTPFHTLESLHRASVHLMSYNALYDTVISVDVAGMVEYWEPHSDYGIPSDRLAWSTKSETSLYEFKKTKSTPLALTISPTGQSFAILSLPSLTLTTFNFTTGKLIRKYDESIEINQEMQQAGTLFPTTNSEDGQSNEGGIDSMEFGRRLAVERELEKNALEGVLQGSEIGVGTGIGSICFDESGGFILYPTMLGIKVVNTVTNKVSKLLGKDETARFLNINLYQGLPIKSGLTTIAMATSENPLLAAKQVRDPTLFCTALKRARFYLFTRENPEEKKGDRDVFNEKPTREEQTIAAPSHNTTRGALGSKACLHTTMGDIQLELYPDLVSKTVENFVGLAKKGYYDNVIFHRVIPKFMLQTGDPFGDGTGGESLWGSSFEDEFVPSLRHDKPYCLSMANAGPKTNGSQFFITCAPTPWLDNKHTIFGRALAGFDVIHQIEGVRCDNGDKPLEEIKIISVEILD